MVYLFILLSINSTHARAYAAGIVKEGSDALYLAIKIVLIMGYTGACRRDELTNMSIHDLEFKSDIILVTVPKTKNNIVRVFAITDEPSTSGHSRVISSNDSQSQESTIRAKYIWSF
ncbi:hypothetical protein QE152_g36180 [Popillia japonica]|uniref:Tyr recombinase domain-containing protein n=1 Tax=Popillia japonica TaxID=7064 RepID=A0AAW1IDF7_POPJA